jgi:prepilin-type N-terminal cleavage/methylation domain-containing protein
VGSGFSLIEAIVAVSIIAIIAAIIIPKMIDTRSHAIVSDLRSIESIIHFLQQKALASHHEQELIIDATAHTYSYQGSLPAKKMVIPLSSHLSFGFLPNVKGPPAKPEKLLTAPCTFDQVPLQPGAYKIIIFSNGKVSAGTVYITDKNRFLLGALTCPISQVSWTRVYAYENGRWINK